MPSQSELQRCAEAYQRLMATQSHLFRRAVEYNRRGNSVSDPGKKQIYKRLRDMWIWLACEGPNNARDLIAGALIWRRVLPVLSLIKQSFRLSRAGSGAGTAGSCGPRWSTSCWSCRTGQERFRWRTMTPACEVAEHVA